MVVTETGGVRRSHCRTLHVEYYYMRLVSLISVMFDVQHSISRRLSRLSLFNVKNVRVVKGRL
jgi:hypothetical protein